MTLCYSFGLVGLVLFLNQDKIKLFPVAVQFIFLVKLNLVILPCQGEVNSVPLANHFTFYSK